MPDKIKKSKSKENLKTKKSKSDKSDENVTATQDGNAKIEDDATTQDQADESKVMVKAESKAAKKARKAHEDAIRINFEEKEFNSTQKTIKRSLPLLLHGYDELPGKKDAHNNTSLEKSGVTPWDRDLQDYIMSGFINVDKPPKPSSHEVVSWIRRILKPWLSDKSGKTGHSGTLDPMVTGCLTTCIGRATRLVKSQQGAGKEYVCVIRLHDKLKGGQAAFAKGLESMVGALFQRPPLISAVKRQLRIRTVYETKLLDYSHNRKLAVFSVKCEAGTYIRTFCVHLGYLLGVGAHMQELRRVKSGELSEVGCNMHSLYDLLDAVELQQKTGDESRLREIIMPLEVLLVNTPRIFIKDSSVASICHGAQLMAPGILRWDEHVTVGKEVVICTVKGEAIALATLVMPASQIATAGHDTVAKLKRVIMDRDVYSKGWGQGFFAQAKMKLKEKGMLDKFGKPMEKTPKEWVDMISGSAPAPAASPARPALPAPEVSPYLAQPAASGPPAITAQPGTDAYYAQLRVKTAAEMQAQSFGLGYAAPPYAYRYPTIPAPGHQSYQQQIAANQYAQQHFGLQWYGQQHGQLGAYQQYQAPAHERPSSSSGHKRARDDDQEDARKRHRKGR